MSQEDNLKLVREIYDAVGRGDVAQAVGVGLHLGGVQRRAPATSRPIHPPRAAAP